MFVGVVYRCFGKLDSLSENVSRVSHFYETVIIGTLHLINDELSAVKMQLPPLARSVMMKSKVQLFY
jgi:hypothetical protein